MLVPGRKDRRDAPLRLGIFAVPFLLTLPFTGKALTARGYYTDTLEHRGCAQGVGKPASFTEPYRNAN